MSSSNNISGGESNNPADIYALAIPFPVRFWLYLILNSLSILCSIFVLYHLLFDRTLRQALNNHVIILLLFVGLTYESTTVPFMLNYYRLGDAWILTPSFARFWSFIDNTCYGIELIGFAWATIERHILIFHQQWLSTKKKRFFIHYLPLIAIVTYCFTYYFVLIIFPTCVNSNFMQPINGVPIPCFNFDPILGKWESICHLIIPTFTIATFSIALLIRVLWQKSRLNRSIQWRQQRKMTIQLLSISTIYLVLNFPRAIIQAFVLSGFTSYFFIKTFSHLIFFAVQLVFYFPFISCGLLPDVEKRLKKLFFCHNRQRVIVPTSLTTAPRRTNQPNQI